MFGIIISVLKAIIFIVLLIICCLGIWIFYNGDDSENETICDGVRVCILVLLMIFITVS